MHIASINIARAVPNPYQPELDTGIGKQPVEGAIAVCSPGPKADRSGSGLAGDFIGDTEHHGGDDQAVYSFAREDLDFWQQRLGRVLANGFFGENLTTVGIDVNEALIGERWRIGNGPDAVELRVTCPRIPCATFRGWIGEPGWLPTFTAVGRPGAYLKVLRSGSVSGGDAITVIRRPNHRVTIAMAFRALTTERALLPGLAVAADDLPDDLRTKVAMAE